MALSLSALDTNIKKRLTQISWASNQATALTRKLLTFTQKSQPALEKFDLNNMILDMKSILAQSFFGKVSLQINCCSSPVVILADRKEMENALLNLVLNAKEAIQEHGEVKVSTKLSNHKGSPAVDLIVQDNGSGLPAPIKQKIFEPFFTTKTNGTGLGLVMVHSVVQKSGGTISVDSQLDNLTTFTLTFPIINEDSLQNNAPEKPAKPNFNDKSEVVMIVEDDHDVRAAISEMLQTGGYRTVEANGVAEAIKLLEVKTVDMIISDSNMPGKSGHDLYLHVSQTHPHIPFVIMSGYIDDPLLYNHHRLIEKPFSLDYLLQMVMDSLEQKSQRTAI